MYISVIVKALTEIEPKVVVDLSTSTTSHTDQEMVSLVLISCLENIAQPFCLIKGSESINNWLRSSSIKTSTSLEYL